MSVAGGVVADGNWPASAGFCGPGSVMLPRFLAFIAPCGGSSGLPKEAARAVAAVIAAPAAVAANIPRRDIMLATPLNGGAPGALSALNRLRDCSLRSAPNRNG